MGKKTESLKKTEADHVAAFLDRCIENKALTVEQAQALYKAIVDRRSTGDAQITMKVMPHCRALNGV